MSSCVLHIGGLLFPFASNFAKFLEIGDLPKRRKKKKITFPEEFNGGSGTENTLKKHKAKWYKECVLPFNSTKLQRRQIDNSIVKLSNIIKLKIVTYQGATKN